jgi:hypothetical protein
MASAIPENSRAEYGFALPSVVIPAFPVRVLARSGHTSGVTLYSLSSSARSGRCLGLMLLDAGSRGMTTQNGA